MRLSSFAVWAACLLAVLWNSPAQAQGKVDVVGVVVDSTGAPLAGATVVLLQPSDSALVGFASAGADGAFRVRAVAQGTYRLRVTFVGYAPHEAPAEVGAGGLDVGRVVLAATAAGLDALVVTADRVPVVVRRDTLDYDAGAFRVPPGSTVEDLLRRLPGVEVERDGTVRAQGERVQRVLVDGKEFFGDDPTVATRNLPADAVDRVQVFDKASDTAEFTGVDDGQESRTINLALKEDRKAGAFGTVSGGLGGTTSDVGGARYDGRASVNRFSPSTQLSVLANANNVNRQSFSFDDYLRFMGGPGALAAGGGVLRLDAGAVPVGGGPSDGFATTWAGGVNLNHEFDARTSIKSSYFGHRMHTDRVRRALRQELVGGAESARVARDADQTDRLAGHRLEATAEHELGEGHDLRLRSSLRVSDTSLDAAGRRETRGLGGEIENTAVTTSASDGRDVHGDARLTYRRRLGGGRSVVAQVGTGVGASDADGRLDSDAQFFEAGRPLSREEIARRETERGDLLSRSAEVLLTQELGSGRALQLTAEHQSSRETQDRTVRDGRSAVDAGLGSAFERSHAWTQAGVTARDNGEALRVSAGLDLRWARLSGLLGTEATTDRSSVWVLPSAALTYSLGSSRTLEARYETSTREPGLRDVLPVASVGDPFDVRVGNPDLRAEYVHGVSGRYVHYDAFTSTTAFAFARASYTAGAISTARVLDERLRQRSTPVNGGGAWTVLGNASLGTPVRPLRSTVQVAANAVVDRRTGFVNGAPNDARLVRGGLDMRLENRDKDVVDAQVGARLAVTSASYSLGGGRRYADRTVYAEVGWTPPGWSVRSTLDVTWYGGDGLGGRRAVPLWDLRASRSFVGGRARVELSATDLLDRTLGVDYTTTATFVEEERVQTLGRRLLVAVSYDLSGPGRRTGVTPVAK